MAAKNPEGLIRIAEGFERSGDYAGARELYAQALAAKPDLTEAVIGLAKANARLGRSDEAISQLTLLLSQTADNRTARFTLARIHAREGRYQSALSQLSQITELNPAELVLRGKLKHLVGTSDAGHAV